MSPWKASELPKPTESLQQLTSDINQWGYCLIANAIDSTDLANVRQRLSDQARAEQEQGHHKMSEVQDASGVNQWIYMLINKGKSFENLLFQPNIMGLLQHVLGDEYVLSDFSAHITRPNTSLLPLHIDQWWLPPPSLPGETHVRPGNIGRAKVIMEDGLPARSTTPINAPAVVNAMWMVSDYTERNGATRLVPGSHLSGKQPAQKVPHQCPTIAAEGPAGTVVVWDGRTWHAAGANNSDKPRYGVTSYYSGPQYRSLSNWTLGVKTHVLDSASPELFQLLGFTPFGGYGHTGSGGGAKSAEHLIGELKAD